MSSIKQLYKQSKFKASSTMAKVT